MFSLRLLIFLSFCLYVNVASAGTEEDGRLWFNVNAVGNLPVKDWHWYAELQPRWREEGSHIDQVIIRPAVFYKLNSQTSLWLGYAHVTTYPDGKKSFDENRAWQQLLHNFEPMGSISLQSRTRLEQRFIENSDETGYKIRQMIRLTIPSQLSPKLQWVVYDEYFMNLNDTDFGARQGFDQNRAFLGVNWAFAPEFKLEAGYLNQYVNTQNNDLSNHALSGTINLSF